ncbi:MAG: alanine racemase, partial [Desulfonatronovibrio sp.]
VAEEKQKYGVLENDLPDLARSILELKHLSLEGLMVMPPFTDNPEDSRSFFARTRRLRHELEQMLGAGLPQLSMGMSADLEVAVEEGATLVRVGTSLLGSRPGCSSPAAP